MSIRRVGTNKSYHVGEEKYKAYIPPKLPKAAEIDMTGLLKLFEEANRELGALNRCHRQKSNHRVTI